MEDPNFSLELSPAWRALANDDAEQYSFRDDARDVDLTLSTMALAIRPDGLDQFANVLVNARLRAEADTARAFERRLTIFEPVIAPLPWGRALAYYGHDDGGRQFSYSAIITVFGFVGAFISSARLGERELMEALDEVVSGIVFDRTPLEQADRLH
jgi:hypothetical protein